VTNRRGLTALLLAETISTAGTRMSQLAVPWLVLTTTGSAIRTGLVGTAEIAPYVLLKIFGAPLVDRAGGRRTAIAGNGVAALAMLAIPLLWDAGRLGLGPLLALVFVAGLARGPADTATEVMLPAVTGAAGMSIERGVALFDGASRTATLLGAPLAGGLITVIGATNVVAIDAGSFLAAAGLLALFVPASAGITTSTGLTASAGIHPERAGYGTQLREGIGYVLRDRLLRSIAGMVLFTNLADAALSGLLLILWAQQRFGSTLRLGVVVAALGAGAVCGAALVAAIGSRLPRRWTFAVAFLIAGAPRFVVLALPAPFWLVLTVWAVSGFAAGAINPLLGAAQYDLVPRRLQARVFSGVGGIAWAGIPFGALLAGVAVGAAGLTATLIGGAVLYALATLDPFLRPAWSGMNRVPAG
jgi:hypothetical protein